MTAASLLVRADASVAMGTGHAMRTLALAQAWQDEGGAVVFAMAETTLAITARLTAESCEIVSVSCPAGGPEDSRRTIALATERNIGWVVVDGYQFTSEYQRALKASGFKILFLDDYGHAPHYSADLVLNQNLGAVNSLYVNREPKTRLLLGPRYCLLRREFSEWRDWKREIPVRARRVLVTMGGSDPENVTARVLEALALTGVDELDVTVVVGGSNPHYGELQNFAARAGQKITVRRDPTHMAELMAAVDVAISAAGSTCWELCRMGLPALLIDVSANQTLLAKELHRQGCAIHVGDRAVSGAQVTEELQRLIRSAEIRQSLSQRSRELVDGRGSARVISILRGECNLRLRNAEESDCRLLWEWASDPEVRAASFSPEAIPWDTHVAWFAARLRPDGYRILIAEDDDGTPIGQIRFHARAGGEYEIDVSIAREARGQRLAAEVIRQGMRSVLKAGYCARMHAFVRPENVASVKSFEKSGFQRAGIERVQGKEAIHFIYEGK